ncbi:MAG: antibiotic biosynthesis monooxygenase [SAR86 cluster bacterium]|uniref:Antibiotic biosynthesis monooxygenase n=1 Tax=SAR86 cluster bacterium TaxID=2030880 RepID=A0A2A5C889_9GAMM|nr:MAG: antibiotic biosynthesis monooxygenase [SAR86 cluster bacterium]
MVVEIAEIKILPGTEADFEAAVEKATEYFQLAKGCRSLKLHKIIENPLEYLLEIGWNDIDDHLVTFRQSEAFQAWRTLVGSYFAEPPRVRHLNTVLDSFTQ